MEQSLHEVYMRMALRRARRAADDGEVPTGCVIVHRAGGEAETPRLVASAHNQTERLRDPTAHAEMIAITQAANALGDWRLLDTVLYVTKEPCVMCAGAIVLARIPLVVYAAPDPRRGGISLCNLLARPELNHRCETISGILETPCRELMQEFFRQRRRAT
jgi:tRNA(adenine34) deaminase